MNIVCISGSPSPRSRSAWLLQLAQARLEASEHTHHTIVVRDLPAHALVTADARDASLRSAIARTVDAQLLVIATPIYKAAYSGLLKIFLDLLPQDALRDKAVLPIATGGSLGHLLAVDYALKPVLSALGARHILDGVFATDAQLPAHASGGYAPDEALVERLERALRPWSSPAAAPRATAELDARC
ncbi:MAG TPA: NADPH-dependent FMN reductase [Albitalea sp.]|uniref:NADPH-dependent FMN reductase n=1 Tax=Piscinibacter sp. TaxID=1903157 RepID=UPI002ED03AC9